MSYVSREVIVVSMCRSNVYLRDTNDSIKNVKLKTGSRILRKYITPLVRAIVLSVNHEILPQTPTPSNLSENP
jgi:hypothetical protein